MWVSPTCFCATRSSVLLGNCYVVGIKSIEKWGLHSTLSFKWKKWYKSEPHVLNLSAFLLKLVEKWDHLPRIQEENHFRLRVFGKLLLTPPGAAPQLLRVPCICCLSSLLPFLTCTTNLIKGISQQPPFPSTRSWCPQRPEKLWKPTTCGKTWMPEAVLEFEYLSLTISQAWASISASSCLQEQQSSSQIFGKLNQLSLSNSRL